MNDWNSIYQEKGVFQNKPSEHVAGAIDSFRRSGVRRILDLGCGTGRHIVLMVGNGFEVYGCDSSEEALKVTSGLYPALELKQCEMTFLPYDSGFFEGVICNHVLQHGLMTDILKAASEILRILRPGGHLFLTAVSDRHPKSFTGREIEPGTRIDTDAIDGHVPHHFFTQDELKLIFEGFEIISLRHITGPSEIEPEKLSASWGMYAVKKG